MMNRGALGEFLMPSLRLDRRLALACLVLLLLMNGAALADPNGAILNGNTPVPQVPTIGPRGQAHSERATEKPAGTAEETAVPIPSAKMAPDANAEPKVLAGGAASNPDQPIAAPASAAVPIPASTPDQETPTALHAATAVNADAPIAQQLRDLASGKFGSIMGSTKERMFPSNTKTT